MNLVLGKLKCSLHSELSFHQDFFAGRGQFFSKRVFSKTIFGAKLSSFPRFFFDVKMYLLQQISAFRPCSPVSEGLPCRFKCFHGAQWRAHTRSAHQLRSRSFQEQTPFCARKGRECASGQPRFAFFLYVIYHTTIGIYHAIISSLMQFFHSRKDMQQNFAQGKSWHL